MTLAACQELTNVSKIKLEEIGRKAIFINTNRKDYIKTRWDGCVVVNSIAADYILSLGSVGDLIVELKATDVKYAAEQIQATAEELKRKKLCKLPIAALIVCNQYPRNSTTVQRAQQKFSKNFKGLLHVRSRNLEYQFIDLF